MSEQTVRLWDAVDRLTNPTRERLERDGGKSQWVRMPSLFNQLAEAVQSGAGSQGHGKQQSRPPLDIAAMSLLIDIAEHVADGCRGFDLKRTRDTPKDLRSLCSELVRDMDDDATVWWTDKLHSWCNEIRAVISNDTDRPWHLHGVPCPECAATHITGLDGNEKVRKPAVLVTWSCGYVRAVSCQMCGAAWFRGADLENLVERMMVARETPQKKSA